MIAIADQIQVAGFFVLAIIGTTAIVGLLILGRAVLYWVEDVLTVRSVRKARAEARQRAYDERQAARVYEFPTSNVDRVA